VGKVLGKVLGSDELVKWLRKPKRQDARERIAKEKAAHKIDVVVALAQAALGAVHSMAQRGGGEAARIGYGSGGADNRSSSTNLTPRPRPVVYLPPIAATPPGPWRYGDPRPCPLPAHMRRSR
jgi:hypothetical protein